VALVSVVAVIVLEVTGRVDADATTLGLLVLAMGCLVAVTAPHETSELFHRVTTFKIAGVEVALGEQLRAERIFRSLPKSEDDVRTRPRPVSGDKVLDVLAVQQELQRKMRFTRDRLLSLGQDEQAYSDVLGRLMADDLLNVDEINVVYILLGDDVASWPAKTRARFLDASWVFATRFASQVFDRQVRRRLSDAGCAVIDFEQTKKHRLDFLVEAGAGRYLVAARLAAPWNTIQSTRRRLAATKLHRVEPVIIVPTKTRIQSDDIFPAVSIRGLDDFLAAVGATHPGP
jgi:hypothetical protein